MSADVAAPAQHRQPLKTARDVRDVQQTTCCIIGGGPAGAVLALLLARKGVPVILLEAHADFDRDFRGDTIHPSVMEIMDQLGLADRLLQLRHTKMHTVTLPTARGPIRPVDLRWLKTRFPYITMMPQADFLAFITAEAQRHPSFRLIMRARVEELIEEGGIIRGVRYQGPDDWHEVRARLTVGADGRFSRVRRLAGLQPIRTSPPIDVLWFRLPRRPGDPEEAMFRLSGGRFIVLLNRFDSWQVAYVIPKGSYQQLHAAGLEALRRSVAELMPEFSDRVEHLQEWKQVSLLSVEADRLPRWYRAGLLLIGDAAHVMSPVGGQGINYAIQDAVVAANVLTEPLRDGRLRMRHLRTVQRRREWPTRMIQAVQTFAQRAVAARALNPDKAFEVPGFVRAFIRLPFLRVLPARVIAFGVWRVRLKC